MRMPDDQVDAMPLGNLRQVGDAMADTKQEMQTLLFEFLTADSTSASLAGGTRLVLDASQTCILDRESVVVQISTEDADNFQCNMVSVRAELRAGLAVFSPAALLSLSLTE